MSPRQVAALVLACLAWAPLGAWSQVMKAEKKQSVTAEFAAGKYQEGLTLERAAKDHQAFEAFLQAGEAGNGPAQRKLANIYDRGNRAVTRDYQSAIRWYERARLQGVEFPKPLPPIKGR